MTTLLLSGWTQATDALAHLAEKPILFDYSEYGSQEKSFYGLMRHREVKHVIAWSLGGQLAIRAISVGALKPKHLTLIAAPYRFTGPDGMGEETFRLFRESFARDAARTKDRFHALVAKGDANAKQVNQQLEHHPDVENTARWLPWLDALGEIDISRANLANLPPTLIIHGMNDAIVPHAQGEFLARTLPKATLHSWSSVGHAPHWHNAKRLQQEIAAHRREHKVA